MVRPKDSIWKHAENLKGRFKCNYCGLEFAGGATRIKSHLSGIKGQGIDKCNEVPEHVRAAAFEVADGSNKRARPLVGSSNIEGSANSAYAQGMQNLDEISTYDSLDENMKILKEKLEDLICQEADIKRKLFAIESLPGKKRKSEVDDWLRDVNRRKQQVFGIETHIRKLTQEVTKLAERNLPEILTFDDANHSGGEVLLQAAKLGRLSHSLENLAKSRNNVLKECFLCCAFYLGNKELETEDLIIRLADEGLVDGTKSLEGQFEEGLNILHELQNSGLLEVESNNVRMDKQSRAVAMSIKEGSFMVRANMPYTQMPVIENMEKVSLAGNQIREISLSTSPKCLKLSTLLLHGNPLEQIKNSFFIHMPAIQILDLSDTCIRILPDIVSDLKTLTALLLSECRVLKYIPSLAKLQALKRLDISNTAIRELPQGLDMLLNLRWLNLSGLNYLRLLPPMFTISKWINIQYLELPCHSGLVKVKADDFIDLMMLEAFAGNFHDLHHFNAYIRTMQAGNFGLRSYILQLGFHVNPVVYDTKLEKDWKVVVIESSYEETPILLPVDIGELYISDIWEGKPLCQIFVSSTATSLRLFDINCIDDLEIEYLLCFSSSCSFCTSLQNLEVLNLYHLTISYVIPKENEARGIFSCLKTLEIWGCNTIKKLLTPGFLSCIPNIQSIKVLWCKSIKEIFSAEEEEGGISIEELFSTEEEGGGQGAESFVGSLAGIYTTDVAPVSTINLPKLVSLNLVDLPELISVSHGIIVCDPLINYSAIACPKLKRPPQFCPQSR